MPEKCPGQDSRYWRPEDVRDARCPVCGASVEFFKDDRSRKCPSCGARFKNPHLDLGCAKWCPYAKDCLDYRPDDDGGMGDVASGPAGTDPGTRA